MDDFSDLPLGQPKRDGWSVQDSTLRHTVLPILITVLALCLATRFLSGRSSETRKDGSVRPALQPYWIPRLAHLPSLLWDPEGLLRRARDSSPEDVFALNVWTKTHNIITTHSLVHNTRRTWDSSTSAVPLQTRMLRNVFGMPQAEMKPYLAIQPRLDDAFRRALRGSSLHSSIAHYLSTQLPDLLTLNPSPVDQAPWERSSTPSLSDDLGSATLSLATLVAAFLTHAATAILLSPAALAADQDADAADVAVRVRAARAALLPLLTGAPRTLPHPALPAAHIARRALARALRPFVRAVALAAAGDEPEPEFRDLLEDPHAVAVPLRLRLEALLKAEQEAGRLGPDALVADFAALLCGVNAGHELAVWLLLHLLAEQEDLKRVRAEVQGVVSAVQPQAIMGFSVPPKVEINVEHMMSGEKCPWLRSAWLETVRVYTRGLESRRVEKAFSVEAGTNAAESEKWAFEQGEYVTMPLWLPNTDPSIWREPEKWRSDRHIKTVLGKDGEKREVVDDGPVLREFGAFGIDDAYPFTEALCLSFVAAFLVLWDIEPAVKTPVLLRSRFAPGVAMPRTDVKVKISKRELPTARDESGND